MPTFFTPIKIYIFIVFITAWLCCNKGLKTNKLLLAILTVSVINEVLCGLFNHIGFSISNICTGYVIVNCFLWLTILKEVSHNKKIIQNGVYLFLFFAIFNLLLLDGLHYFNSYTFVFGALLYVLFFLYDSSNELRKENFDYFNSPTFILISAPVLFFIGFSFTFGFKTNKIDKIIIYNHITLYNFISWFVNFIYYSLILVYVYQNKKVKNV
jgi:hypothetical protein